jgi:hypothetical protein
VAKRQQSVSPLVVGDARSSREQEESSADSSANSGPITTTATTTVTASVTTTMTKTVSRMDFFKQLAEEEGKKGQVGTAHAVVKDSYGSEPSDGTSQDWVCPKCSKSNFKNSNQCQKCHALKRMSQFR